MYKLKSLTFILIIPQILFAADSTKIKTNTLGLGAGYGSIYFSEPYASANIYSGKPLPLNFHWIVESAKHIERLDLNYFSSSLKTTNRQVNLTDFKGVQFDINYGYYFKIKKKEKAIFYLGPGIYFLYSYKSLKYKFFEDVLYNIVDINFSLDVRATAKFNIKQDWILFNAGYSLLAYTGFLKYSLGSPYKGSVMVFPKYNSFNLNADYFLFLTKRISVNFGYKFFYYCFPKFDGTEYSKGAISLFLAGLNIKI